MCIPYCEKIWKALIFWWNGPNCLFFDINGFSFGGICHWKLWRNLTACSAAVQYRHIQCMCTEQLHSQSKYKMLAGKPFDNRENGNMWSRELCLRPSHLSNLFILAKYLYITMTAVLLSGWLAELWSIHHEKWYGYVYTCSELAGQLVCVTGYRDIELARC